MGSENNGDGPSVYFFVMKPRFGGVFFFDWRQITKATSQGLFHFAVFHQQVLHHLVKRALRPALPDGAGLLWHQPSDLFSYLLLGDGLNLNATRPVRH